MRGRNHYACGRHLDGRACVQKTGIKRSVVEPGLLEGIRTELLSPKAVQAAADAAHRVLREHEQAPAANPERLAALEAEIDNLADAIAGGALKSSSAVARRLAKAEAELAESQALGAPAPRVAQLIPRIADEYRQWV